jgi:hypothetical protein
MEELKGLFEKIIREEVATTLKQPPPHRLAEFFTDPGSREYSMSRLCFGLLILGILALDVMAVLLGLIGRLPDSWVGHLTTMNTVALASVAGVYGANSVVGAWRNVGDKVKHLLSTPGKGSLPDFPDE